MNRRDILRRLERLEASTKATQRTRPDVEPATLALEELTPENVAHLARWIFRGDHSQPMPADIAQMLTLATGEPWQEGKVIA